MSGARALLVTLRLLDGRYHGAGDWPPSPFRLFQALVAGAYGGRWAAEPPEAKDRAFRWLEGLPAPLIAAPPVRAGAAFTHFVPNNDLDAVGGDPARLADIRVPKRVRPLIVTGEAALLYAWRFDRDDDGHARLLCRLAERLHRLGRGVDPAFAEAAVHDWPDAEARLAAHGGAIARPS
ncbi:MAG: type I-U CRISPR-associated protein Cas5/Cas6, partial [Alphaproteobacteria bacterium]|nr:type I-U CRISPR-associated protein Cas5/Cas6 [Alphaproteobacteria bacterium]